MKHITSRLLALLLTLAMIISMMPAVYAADEDVTIVENEQPTVEETIVENSTEDTTVEPAKAVEANFSESTTEGTTTYVAKVGETSYTTLGEAVKAATPGDTIVLQDNIEITSKQSISKQLTLDLNGKIITGTAFRTSELTSTGDLTVKDSIGGGKIANSYSGSATSTTVLSLIHI